jgi:hypothetical protein
MRAHPRIPAMLIFHLRGEKLCLTLQELYITRVVKIT